MVRARCWSSIVAGPTDRAALRMPPQSSWLLTCDLPDGHPGFHASDGGRGGTARRAWLLWGDFARTPQACRELAPCEGRSIDAAQCTLFAGHGGMHRFPALRPISEPLPVLPPTPESRPAPRPVPAPARPPAPAPPPTPAPAPEPIAVPAPIPVPPAEGVEMTKQHKDAKPGKRRKNKDAPADAPVDAAYATPMIQVNDYADLSRTSFIEVIGPDGQSRTVVAPVTSAPDPRPQPPTVVNGSLAELERATVVAAADTALAATSAAVRAADTLPDEQSLVRRQVGDALREVAQALSKLADSLDPQ